MPSCQRPWRPPSWVCSFGEKCRQHSDWWIPGDLPLRYRVQELAGLVPKGQRRGCQWGCAFICVCTRGGAGGVWASVWGGQFASWAHGGCTTAIQARAACLEAIPPQFLEENLQVRCPELPGPQETLLTACSALHWSESSLPLAERSFGWK